jgi:hypothetical protein
VTRAHVAIGGGGTHFWIVCNGCGITERRPTHQDATTDVKQHNTRHRLEAALDAAVELDE